MNGALSDEAIDVATAIRECIAARGGMALLRRAVLDPAVRTEAEAILDSVGIWELDPLTDQIELEVAAASCQAAGFYALPYPIAERLGRRRTQATALVGIGGEGAASHIDLPLTWSAVDLRGDTYRITRTAPDLIGSELAPFASVLSAERDGEADAAGAAVLATLQSWWLLGLLEHALADTVRYTREREQFGRPLIKFQGVSFQLADMAVAVQSLAELAKYTVWTISRDPESALTDAVGLRLAAQTAADEVLHGAHQLHGAMGFTNEVDVSWLSRASQGVRRLPEGEHRTASVLTELIERDGWRHFGHPEAAPGPAAAAR